MEEAKKTKLEKVMKVLKITMLTILILAGVLYYGVRIYFKTPITNYYNASAKAFVIPGLNDDFVPQGFCYDENETQYLISGYNSQGKASSIYVVNDEKDEEQTPTKRVSLAKADGKAFTGHAGGVAINGDYVYLANGQYIYVFLYSDIKQAKNGDKVCIIGSKPIKSSSGDDAVSASFVHTCGDKLYVGEFHDGGKYKVNPAHKETTPTGEKRNALMLEYDLNVADSEYGIAKKPNCVFAIPNKVQGVCVDGDKIYLSTSYGLSFSQIFKYDLAKSKLVSGEKTVLGQSLPLYYFDRACYDKTYKTAPMAEELVYKDGKLYIMSEFACNKYIMGKFVDGKYCYATDLSKM